MWSFFSRDAVKDFGYILGSKVDWEHSIWKLYHGKKKGSEDPVSIFTCETSGPETEALIDLAKAVVKRLKTLRHPSILTYIDSLETDKLVYLVTEVVTPLDLHLLNNAYTKQQKNFAISWGLYQIASALSFLHDGCRLSHNNVCLSSIFVDQAGEWCLFGLEFMSACQEVLFMKMNHQSKYNPPEFETKDSKKHDWSYDSWGLGCLVWEVFNGSLPKTSSLQAVGSLPANLTPLYCQLVCANPLSRPSPAEFLKKASKGKGFFKNKFIETMLFLTEVHIKDKEEKIQFFSDLQAVLDSFPQDTCVHKILPELITAYEFGNAGSSILTPIFKLGRLLPEDEYQQKIVPCIVKMFSSKDRTTRAKLLQQIDDFISHLSPNVINAQIFPNVAQGFLDSSPTIRECTVKCILNLAPKLNYQNLNEEVLKHFARLQTKDDQGGIRTNTTVCLGKVASYLHPQTRKKVLISAFLRALRDPFPPARTAGILAFLATEMYYSINDCATRVLPALCHFTVDPEKSVRDQAFKAIGSFLQKLQKVSEDPSLIQEMEEEVQSVTPSAIAASWTSWAVTSLVDKLHIPSLSKSPSDSLVFSPSPEPKGMIVDSSVATEKEETEKEIEEATEEQQGWDSWNDDEPISVDTEVGSKSSTQTNPSNECNEWDVDSWEGFEDINSEQKENNKKLSSYFANDSHDDPFTSESSKINKEKMFQSVMNNSDGWDLDNEQWEDSWTSTASNSILSEKQEQKREENKIAREEKRRQRLKERQVAKPKKLGATKIS